MPQRRGRERGREGERGGWGELFALLGGVLMGVTVAPFNVWFLAWVALSPLWVLVREGCEDSGLKWWRFLVYPALWGVGYHGLALFWITGIHPMTWMGIPWLTSLAIAFLCWVLITLWGVALVSVWAVLFRLSHRGKSLPIFSSVIIGTALWCALEQFWSMGALWWTSISYTQSPYNLVILHLGQLSGTSAVTGAIVAVNALLAEGWLRRRTIKLPFYLPPLGLCLILHAVGYGLYLTPLAESVETALKVGVIQGNIGNDIKLSPVGFQRAIAGYTKGYIRLVDEGVNAVLTPEGALPFFLRDIKNSNLVAAIKEKGITAWVGGFGERGTSYNNSLFTFTATGEVFSRYDKHKLVPVGEYIPFEEILGGIINRLSPLEAHQVPGAENQIFDTPFGRAIVGICYESAFPEQFRRQAAAGGEFILSAANNAHYSVAMPAQHHAQDIMRAIESDRWAVRATNTGYSGFVNPHGKTLWISGHNTYETHAETIYRRQSKTLYVRWGNWLTPLLLILGILILGLRQYRQVKS
ncbi:apolipoprotein N-acyltransferase [Calothrix sp. PCC 6303]|uniref:apolipoprotein N-acyltransferase n=2 Tax=Calothrix sp. PCC 6303 TaxID=1170562 RepID=UPI0002A02754|nr:Apolipoprotein N-acyltransferase [Calothrix sp. PCC 6303]